MTFDQFCKDLRVTESERQLLIFRLSKMRALRTMEALSKKPDWALFARSFFDVK